MALREGRRPKKSKGLPDPLSLLGHKDVTTTMIYTHVLIRGGKRFVVRQMDWRVLIHSRCIGNTQVSVLWWTRGLGFDKLLLIQIKFTAL